MLPGLWREGSIDKVIGKSGEMSLEIMEHELNIIIRNRKDNEWTDQMINEYGRKHGRVIHWEWINGRVMVVGADIVRREE